ncbi:MAG TPA: tRNA (N6-isopentenyl adenosine(37)-C2)-methylthiotransferase MiaB [Chitinispirillaceae bacterium]|nr:tRNA (N6-isopentenyl adenosine(37)-C2)-methylthiotransferase MiaB [Chitinispirillaceae bacterium]
MPLFFFQTFGCQMNIADSDDFKRELLCRGYSETADAHLADLLIVNTCSVRENAESRAKSRIQEFGRIKKRGAALWVIGCMAQRLGDKLKEEIKNVDRVIGTRQGQAFLASLDQYLPLYNHSVPQAEQHASPGDFVAVMRGCENYCTYCIVPHVRGPEISISAQEIVSKISERVKDGISEFTLLGQNVNSYHDAGTDFADLLKKVASIDGVRRVRFTTSHPKDCSKKLIETIAAASSLCKHIHLPVQAGSNRILGLMNRKYTAEHYHGLIEMIRSYLPDADITSDIMVGFPGETEQEFEDTLRLVEKVRYTTAFMFAYSAREGTVAASMADTVPEEVKLSRLKALIDLQTSITKKIYDDAVGHELEVMINGRQEKREKLWMGMDVGFKKVLLSCDNVQAGMILKVRAVRSSGMTLICERITQ